MSASATILVAEDDPNDAELLRRAFSSARSAAAVRMVTTSDDLEKYLRGSAAEGQSNGEGKSNGSPPFPALLLVDLKFRPKDGFEAIRWIRSQEPPIRELPIIVITGSRYQPDITKAYGLGANCFLVKPSSLGELTEQVRAISSFWLQQAALPRGAAAAVER